MSYGQTVSRGGLHYRLAQPAWTDPLDMGFAKARGGRWNAAGSFGVLYLNATVALARLQVTHKLAGQPYGVEDLDETEQHDLVHVQVTELDALDCISDSGLQAVALPTSYPADDHGAPIGWPACQAVGQLAYDAGLAALACRSAAAGATDSDDELGIFDTHAAAASVSDREAFANWYWNEHGPRS